MADQQNFDISEVKSERFDVLPDKGHAAYQAAVDQDVALRSCNQIRGQIFAPHVVQISRDAKGDMRSNPVRISGWQVAGDSKRQEKSAKQHAKEYLFRLSERQADGRFEAFNSSGAKSWNTVSEL
jgi:hypothetical protein